MSASPVDKVEDEKARDTLDEKRPASESELSSVPLDGDEALHLVGAERTVEFSEEYNLKLRRKLVSIPSLRYTLIVMCAPYRIDLFHLYAQRFTSHSF